MVAPPDRLQGREALLGVVAVHREVHQLPWCAKRGLGDAGPRGVGSGRSPRHGIPENHNASGSFVGHHRELALVEAEGVGSVGSSPNPVPAACLQKNDLVIVIAQPGLERAEARQR